MPTNDELPTEWIEGPPRDEAGRPIRRLMTPDAERRPNRSNADLLVGATIALVVTAVAVDALLL